MKKILTPIKDTGRLSERIVKMGAVLSSRENARLVITYVYEVPMAYSLDVVRPEETEKADHVLDRAVEIIEEFDVPVETHMIQARSAGAGIMGQIKDLKVDTVVMGMDGKEGEKLPFDSTVGYVLKSADCEMVLIHPPKPAK